MSARKEYPTCPKHGIPKSQRLKMANGKPVGWRCPRCHSERQRARVARVKFAIDPATMTEMIKARGGRCDICLKVPQGEGRHAALHLDHDHATGKFRGLLCRGCNLGIGFLRDEPERCESAAGYLRRWLGT